MDEAIGGVDLPVRGVQLHERRAARRRAVAAVQRIVAIIAVELVVQPVAGERIGRGQEPRADFDVGRKRINEPLPVLPGGV